MNVRGIEKVAEWAERLGLTFPACVPFSDDTTSVKEMSRRVLVFQEITQPRIAVGVLDAASGSMNKPRRMKSNRQS